MSKQISQLVLKNKNVCANADCLKPLSLFELTRINPNAKMRSKFCFCWICRRQWQRIKRIWCMRCHCVFSPLNTHRKYCDGCREFLKNQSNKKRRFVRTAYWLEYNKKKYARKKALVCRGKRIDALLYLLKTNHCCSVFELMAFTGLMYNSIKHYIHFLRKKGHMIKCTKSKSEPNYYRYLGLQLSSSKPLSVETLDSLSPMEEGNI